MSLSFLDKTEGIYIFIGLKNKGANIFKINSILPPLSWSQLFIY